MNKYLPSLLLSLLLIAAFPYVSTGQTATNDVNPWLLEDITKQDYSPVTIASSTSSSTSALDDTQYIVQWSTHGTDFGANAIASSSAGLVVGGGFFRAGDIQAGSIAIYDPVSRTWDDMNGGLAGGTFLQGVQAIAVDGDNIYVGGSFTEAGGTPATRIAVYSITSGTWSALGSGLDGTVRSILVSGSQVYVGGSFSTAGGAPASNIAAWDGSSWASVADGLNNTVYALEIFNNELYAGGSFTASGATTMSRLAKFNGVSWSEVTDGVGEGVDGTVFALEANGSSLYIGGDFSSAATVTGFNNIAAWNSGTSTFSPLGPGFTNQVNDILFDGSSLIASGLFESSGISDVKFIAEWNGTTWNEIDGGLWASDLSGIAGNSLAQHNGDLYVGGYFSGAGSTPGTSAMGYDGTNWFSLGSGPNNAPVGTIPNPIVWDLVSVDNGFIAAGTFLEHVGNMPAGIIRWHEDTDSWTSYGIPTNGGSPTQISALLVDGDNLYIGGFFDAIDGVAANNIAVYNMASDTWSPLGSGTDGNIVELLMDGTNLYVGGDFADAGGTAADNIAVWNGTTWSSVGTGVNGQVRALAIFQSRLYAGGQFSEAGGNLASNLAQWDGAAWSPLDDGTDQGASNVVFDLKTVDTNTLYIAGNFGSVGSQSATGIATWDGSSFQPRGAGLSGTPYKIVEGPGGLVYVAGIITTSGLTTLNGVGVWDGSQWSPLGSGFNYIDLGGGPVAMDISDTGNDIYMGGIFSIAGGKPAHNLARYNLAPNTAIEDDLSPSASSNLVVESYPNPFTDYATIDVNFDRADRVTIRVYDILGREVSTVANNAAVSAGSNTFSVDGRDLRSGVYFYRVEASGRMATGVLSLVR